MTQIFRWLVRAFIGLSTLFLCCLLLAYYFAVQSLPDYSRDDQVQGTLGEIEIVRDNHNVPHIFAEHDQDLFFGLGYAHAQDRLWQMTIMRRTAQGRLSEIFGQETIEIDEFIRRLDIYRIAQQSYQYQDPEAKVALNSYADGVNAWLRIVQAEALGRGAPEFFFFEPEIAPWTPADSLAVTKMMTLQTSGHIQSEVLRARASLAVGERLVKDVLPDVPNDAVRSLPEFTSLFDGLSKPTRMAQAHPLDPSKPLGFSGASNAWAAKANRTARGAPLLAADPHLGLSAPSIWMQARLEFKDASVIGGTIPGLPLVLLGRSQHLAWGLTTAYLDDADVFVEKLNTQNSKEYLTPDGFKQFRTESVILDVKDMPGITLDLRWTENGPVIPGERFNLADITPLDHVTSISWTLLEPKDRSFSAGLKIMHSKTISAARSASRDYHAPAQNLILADKNSVALQMIGAMPNRDDEHVSKGRIPSRGWLPRNRWRPDYLPFSDNPSAINPSSGIVANTNNKTTDAAFPRHVSYTWGDTQRIMRLTRLLGSRKIHTRDSFMETQLDQVSFTARSLLPLVAKELWFAGQPAPEGTPERQRQIALDLLANWNGEMDQHVPEPLIYVSWMHVLQEKLLEDELGPLSEEFSQLNPVFIERVFRDIDGASVWCDVRPSTKVETCPEIAQNALDTALLQLTEKYGDRIDSWRWGQAHQAHHDHQVLGKIPLLSWFVNIRQDTPGGDNTLQRAKIASKGNNPFANVHAAGLRILVDFADPESSLFIISTGQSGHFLSRFYDDQSQLWRRGEYIPMTLDPELARSGAVGITHLRPKEETPN